MCSRKSWARSPTNTTPTRPRRSKSWNRAATGCRRGCRSRTWGSCTDCRSVTKRWTPSAVCSRTNWGGCRCRVRRSSRTGWNYAVRAVRTPADGSGCTPWWWPGLESRLRKPMRSRTGTARPPEPTREQAMTELDAEDNKLLVLARGALGRTGGAAGAAIRDTDGRTYAAGEVGLQALRLTALQSAVAAAISSGAEGFEAAVVVGGKFADAGVTAVR